jgi:hypothetical protein
MHPGSVQSSLPQGRAECKSTGSEMSAQTQGTHTHAHGERDKTGSEEPASERVVMDGHDMGLRACMRAEHSSTWPQPAPARRSGWTTGRETDVFD